ncbi:MAG: DUF2341 domain-containing protein, partial [Fibrobacteria bacterium]|nr:DUF2341 domain-containing protein [Fibrobacteria bacterium]
MRTAYGVQRGSICAQVASAVSETPSFRDSSAKATRAQFRSRRTPYAVRGMFILIFVFAALLPAADYSSWSYSRKIYLNTTEEGANVTGNEENFPVLVRLSSTNFTFSEADTDGDDIRFTKSDGTTDLSYELERWSDAADSAEIWVKVDTVYGNNNTQYFYMYWGKASQSTASSPSNVFQTSNDFEGVWHLQQTGAHSVDKFRDATSNGDHGTGLYMANKEVTGAIGLGQTFDGTDDWINLGTSDAMDNAGALSVSFWCWADAINFPSGYDGIFARGDETERAPYVYAASGSNTIVLDLGTPSGSEDGHVLTAALTQATWHYVTFTWDGSTVRAYLDGTAGSTDGTTGNTLKNNASDYNFFGQRDGQVGLWDGKLDEIRISSTNRSANWITLCYQNQKSTQTLVEHEETYSNWTYDQSYYLNTTATGADVSDDVENFPVLVRLNSSNFTFAQAQTNGEDIRFAKSDGTHLNYEIERWSDAADSAEIWVLVDTVYGNNSSQYFKMYWGRATADDRSCGACVYDTSQSWEGVWHLNDVSDVDDATQSDNDGTNTGTADVGGNIGHAANFNGADYITLPPASLTDVSTQITISVWQYGDPAIQPQVDVLYHATASGPNVLYSQVPYSDGAIHSYIGNTVDNISKITEFPGDWEGRWNYWTFTKNTSTGYMRIYCNGREFCSGTGNTNQVSGVDAFRIGALTNNAWYYDGYIDEFRLSSIERSSDWIKLSYENQRPNQTLLANAPNVENYGDWTYNANMYLNTTSSGADVADNVLNFPVLVRLTGSNFTFDNALTNGEDIRFAKSDGTHLFYEIERWNSTVDSAEIWVLIDTVYGNNAAQYFKMYWGKAGSADSSNSRTV